MAATDRVHFGHMEGLPIRFTSTEAWCFNPLPDKRQWEKIHPAEAYETGRLLSKDDYDYQFRNDPPPALPDGAFKGLDLE